MQAGRVSKPKVKFMGVAEAAAQAGYSVRQFRRIITEDSVPVLMFDRKGFVMTKDLMAWIAHKPQGRHSRQAAQ